MNFISQAIFHNLYDHLLWQISISKAFSPLSVQLWHVMVVATILQIMSIQIF